MRRLLAALQVGLALLLAMMAGRFGATEARCEELPTAPAVWVVAELRGVALSRLGSSDSAWQPLRLGMPIAVGSELRTEPNGEVTLTNGQDRIQLAGNSQVALVAAPADPVTRVRHWLGRAFFAVGKRPAPLFEVETPYLVAIVKGTRFTSEVSEAGGAISVEEGVVAVSSGQGGGAVDVGPGQTARVGTGTGAGVTVGRSGAAHGDRTDADAGDGKGEAQGTGDSGGDRASSDRNADGRIGNPGDSRNDAAERDDNVGDDDRDDKGDGKGSDKSHKGDKGCSGKGNCYGHDKDRGRGKTHSTAAF
jgi:hypothetical protein